MELNGDLTLTLRQAACRLASYKGIKYHRKLPKRPKRHPVKGQPKISNKFNLTQKVLYVQFKPALAEDMAARKIAVNKMRNVYQLTNTLISLDF